MSVAAKAARDGGASHDGRVLKYLLASHHPPYAQAIGVPLSLREIAAPRLLAGDRAAGAVALTFDDGPHPEGTPAILELLAAHGVHATFFLVGEQVVRRPELARRIVAAGHGVALHGFVHRVELLRSRAQMHADLGRGIAAIEDAAGVTPRWLRAPMGIFSPAALEFARAHDLQPILWSKWGCDWRRYTTPERIRRRVVTGLRAGDVVLLHDSDFYGGKGSYRNTAAALEPVLARLGTAGLATVRFAHDLT
jgi:peptidoglycan/xylan/chitin deacetylase (PgdA/CDA1 family)